MPTKRDYYEVLEVGRSASPEELRRAYRRLAKQYHPDVNKDDSSEERFKEINEAYAVLSDEERRASYDRFGHAGVQGLPTAGGPSCPMTCHGSPGGRSPESRSPSSSRGRSSVPPAMAAAPSQARLPSAAPPATAPAKAARCGRRARGR